MMFHVKIDENYSIRISFDQHTQLWFCCLTSYDFRKTYYKAYGFSSEDEALQAGKSWFKEHNKYLIKEMLLPLSW
jgi:hypothetical protein